MNRQEKMETAKGAGVDIFRQTAGHRKSYKQAYRVIRELFKFTDWNEAERTEIIRHIEAVTKTKEVS